MRRVELGEGSERGLWFPRHPRVDNARTVRQGLDKTERRHVEVVTRVFIKGRERFDKGTDERTVDTGAVEDGQRLDNPVRCPASSRMCSPL